MEYIEFIKQKEVKIKPEGFDVCVNELNPILFEWQKTVVKRALLKGRFLLGEDAGLGKTFQQLEWAYQINQKTGKDILIAAPLGVVIQTATEEAPKMGYEVHICRSKKDVKTGINITNYEMVHEFKDYDWGGVVLDESSILKNFTGATRILLKDIFRNTPYKLCASATPAPNEYMELLNQADFLGVMDTSKALANFFINDFKTGSWRLKGHATDAFWKWVCSWALIIDKPSDIGFDDSRYELPKLTIYEELLEVSEIDNTFENGLFRDIQTSATGFHKEKRNTAKMRVKRTADIVNNDTENQYLIWCDTNQEADLLKEAIPSAVEVRGSHNAKFKEDATMRFKSGEIRILISKPSIFGYGMNFQMCSKVVFCGLTYSYEDYYQALKRIWRFGQRNEVDVYIILGSTEKKILEVIREKEAKQIEIKNQMNNSLKELQILEIQGKEIERIQPYINVELPMWL